MFMSTTRTIQLAVLFIAYVLTACSSKYSYQENDVPEPVKLSPRLHKIFAETKLVCFGRYALRVPQEAQLVWGSVWFPSDIDVINGGTDAVKRHVADYIAKLKSEDDTAEITYNGEGPIPGSWQLRYYEGETSKKHGLHFFNTYVTKDNLTFILGGSLDGATEDLAAARQATRARSLRLRAPDEIPTEPGYCIEHAFFSDATYTGQEAVDAGIYLPSMPDVTFSISSNKNAYSDYPPEEFEKTQRGELSLLARIKQAQEDQGTNYPKRTVLREGKRNVQHWHGEESLIRRNDGVHDFEWAFVGTPKDVANPSEFNVRMYTKVKHNTVGAAKAASVSDDEAVALWDKLLSGLKFRVKVPRTPDGSYFIPSGKTDTSFAGQ